MRLNCFFDALSDICVGFITMEAGKINSRMPMLYKGEILTLHDHRYPVNQINWMATIPREMNLDVYPLGLDLTNLLFEEERMKSCKL